MDEYKTCSKCKQALLISNFSLLTARPGKRNSRCLTCQRQAAKEASARWRSLNPGYGKDYVSRNREKTNANLRTWRQANPGKQSAYAKKSRNKDTDRAQQNLQRYYKKNPEFLKWKAQRRRARKKANGVFSVTRKEFIRLYAMPCIYCGAQSEHIDHVIPLSRGGRHSIGNLAPSCANCNLSKQDKFITEWKKSERRGIVDETKGQS